MQKEDFTWIAETQNRAATLRPECKQAVGQPSHFGQPSMELKPEQSVSGFKATVMVSLDPLPAGTFRLTATEP
jgi:hypothetical protein